MPKDDNQTQLDLGQFATETPKIDKYEFEPIQGYPMLNWRGKRPFRSTQFYPAQLKEVHGPEVDGWRNRIYWGDNLQVMSHLLKEFRGKVDLIYIDPPFDSKADYKKRIKIKGNKIEGDSNSFEEKQYSDIWTNDEFLQFMYERLVLMRELLSEKGAIFLHCDPGKGHHIRCLMDEIFGATNFLNEVIWSYRRWPSNTKAFQAMHDNLLYYAKNKLHDRAFNKEYEEASESYMKRFGGKTQILDEETGTRKITSDEDTKGMPRRDVWDISIIAGFKGERTGYPTQKPEELLERIISCCSNGTDLVFDGFMGCGTTQAVAMKLGRRFIGADINLGAVQTTTKRLLTVATDLDAKQRSLGTEPTSNAVGQDEYASAKSAAPTVFCTGFEVHNVNQYDVFRNPIEAKELLIEALEIQPLGPGSVYDGEKDGRLVKIMPVNRIATKADLNELIAGFDWKTFQRRQADNPRQAVEKVLLVCMGHEPDLAAALVKEAEPFKIDVEVVDILRDKAKLEFKRDAEADVAVENGQLVIRAFYPMNLLQKLSLMKEQVDDWRELVESVMVDWNYDGAVLEPALVDVPDKNALVVGTYPVPPDAGTIRVKITDLLSESLEVEVVHG